MEAADDKEVSENNVSVNKKNVSTVTSDNNMKGLQLILCSLAGISTAVGITITRWILLESGEVLLLFSNSNNEPVEDDDGICENYTSDSDSDLTTSTCTTQDYNPQNTSLSKQIGELLQTIASSQNMRCIPIIILLISSTTLIIGIISTHQTIQYYYEKLYTKQNELKLLLVKQIDTTVQYMDNLILDDVLHKITKCGIEISFGLWSGLLLYSLPDELFTNTSLMNNNAVNTRRRLVNATDPTLDRTLFTQGGIWDIVPSQLKDVLINNSSTSRSGGGVQRLQLTNSSDSRDEKEEEGTDTTYSVESNEGSSQLAASPAASSSPVPIQIIHAKSNNKGEEENTSPTNNQGSNESIADVLSATINDLIVSNITGGGSTRHETNVQDSPQGTQEEEPQEEEDPPKFQLDKMLHHTSIAATFLFMFHLRSSSSTRRAWGSAVKILTSLGLISTAVGAGAASSMLNSSNHSTKAGITNPLAAMLYSKMMDQLRIPKTLPPIVNTIGSRVQWLQEQVRKNDKLKTVVALIVFYGMRRYTRKGGKSQQTIMSSR